MEHRTEPKTFGEVFALFATLWRENGPVGFARLAFTLGKTPTAASR